jgi:hypothetical protein
MHVYMYLCRHVFMHVYMYLCRHVYMYVFISSFFLMLFLSFLIFRISSPFVDQPSSTDPQYNIPSCYIMNIPPTLKSEHLNKFQMETLFYMFYTMPKDIMQALAAQELYRREWRYHGELKIWLKARSPQDLMQSHPTIPFIFFDTATWATQLFTTSFRGNIAAGLLTEEDVRVKVPMGISNSAASGPGSGIGAGGI